MQAKNNQGRYYETIDYSSNGIVNRRRFTCMARPCIHVRWLAKTRAQLVKIEFVHKSTQVHARAGQTKPQAHQSSQLACTFRSIWSGLYRKLQRIPKQINDKLSDKRLELYLRIFLIIIASLTWALWPVPINLMYSDEILLVWRGFKNSIFYMKTSTHLRFCYWAILIFFKPTVSMIIQKHFGQLQIFRSSLNVLSQFARCFLHKESWEKNEGKVKHGRKQKLVHVYLTCLHRPWREESFREIRSFYRPGWELVGHMHHCERIREHLTYPGHRVKLCKFVFIRNLSRREDLGQSDSWTNGLLRRKNEKRLDKETKHCSFFATSYETYQSNRLVHISKSRPAIRCVKIELSQVGASCSSSVAFGKRT